MLKNLNISNILFLDIETVSNQPDYESLDDTFKGLWQLKTRSILRKYDEPVSEEDAQSTYGDKAGIYAEFGKIVCISVGFIVRDKEKESLAVRLKSYASDDETELLQGFVDLVQQYFKSPHQHFFCGHNLREFDIPYICRRMMVNQMELPPMLDIAGKKPWETKHLLDTMTLWKFGDFKSILRLNY